MTSCMNRQCQRAVAATRRHSTKQYALPTTPMRSSCSLAKKPFCPAKRTRARILICLAHKPSSFARFAAPGTPVVAVILAGRPLTLTNIVDEVDAILFAWHPGTMGGAAIAEILFGVESPSGKLPATFPGAVGQIPIYYNQKNSGKPAKDGEIVHIDEIDARAPQTSLGMSAFHLDAGFRPLFPFGFGLSYTEFDYSNIVASDAEFSIGGTLTVSADLTNTGDVAATEVAQLYVRDLVGEVTRPVRELKGFKRVHVEPGQTLRVEFELSSDDLAFYGRNNELIVQPGEFHAWVGGDSDATLRTEFRLRTDD